MKQKTGKPRGRPPGRKYFRPIRGMVDPQTEKAVIRIANRDGIGVSTVLRQALDQYIQEDSREQFA